MSLSLSLLSYPVRSAHSHTRTHARTHTQFDSSVCKCVCVCAREGPTDVRMFGKAAKCCCAFNVEKLDFKFSSSNKKSLILFTFFLLQKSFKIFKIF
jgi:hypothetical protein